MMTAAWYVAAALDGEPPREAPKKEVEVASKEGRPSMSSAVMCRENILLAEALSREKTRNELLLKNIGLMSSIIIEKNNREEDIASLHSERDALMEDVKTLSEVARKLKNRRIFRLTREQLTRYNKL